MTWLQAFSIPTVILVSSESTTREEAAGLAAHSCLIIQLSRDLSGSQWLKYYQQFQEWAAAKGIRRWAELNLPSMVTAWRLIFQMAPLSITSSARSEGVH